MDKKIMTPEEEWRYGLELFDRITETTEEEKEWLQTHKSYSYPLGYPYLARDIIEIEKSVLHDLHITVESVTHQDEVGFTVKVPLRKGYIMPSFPVKSSTGKIKTGKPIKLLTCQYYEDQKETQLKYRSDLGLLGISFYSYVNRYDGRVCIDSGLIETNAAMLREDMAYNKVRYRCKSAQYDKYDSMVFTVEWIRAE